jgi:hypothetical protein
MLRVFANDHDAAVPADDLALIAAWLDGCSDFHSSPADGAGVGRLLEAVGNPTAGKVVRRKLNEYSVSRKDFDEVDTDFAAYVSQNFMPVCQLHFEHGVGQWLGDGSFYFNSFLLGHTLLRT